MNKEEEFKQTLNDILASKEFAFDEANWAGAKQLIDDAKRKRRIAFYLVLPFLFLVLPLATYLYFVDFQEPAATNQAAKVRIEPAPLTSDSEAKQYASQPAEETKVATNTVSESMPPAVSLPASATENNHKPSLPAPSVAPVRVAQSPVEEITRQTEAPVKQNFNAGLIPSQANTKLLTEPTSTVNDDQKVASSDQKSSVGSTPTGQVSTASVTAGQSTTEVSGKLPVETPLAVSGTTYSPQPESGGGLTKSEDLLNAPGGSTASPVITAKNEGEERKETITAPEPNQTANTDKSFAVAPTDSSTFASSTSLMAGAISAPDKPDTTKTSILLPDQNAAKNMLIAELGVAYNFGWNNKDSREGNGFNPLAGIYFSSALTSKLSGMFGIRYVSVSNLKFSSQTSRITRYGFAEESDVNVITPSSLHYLSVPIQAGYLFNADNAFGLGYNFNYLFNVVSKVETYHEGIRDIQNYSSTRENGYTEGFRAFDSQVSLFYRRRLKGNFWINTEISYGLSDLKDNAFFDLTKTERNSGIRLSLLYNFYRR